MTPHLSALAFLHHTTSLTHLVLVSPALPHQARHSSVASGPALRPSGLCGPAGVSSLGDSLSGASRHLSPGPD